MNRREIVVATVLAAVLGGLYLSEQDIGPQFATALAILIAGQALIAIVDDVFPREHRGPKSED